MNTPLSAPSPAQSLVVVGGGQAAASACAALRASGYEAPIVVLSDERHLPYQRPPLSKAYLKGDLESTRLVIKPEDWYRQQNIDLRLNSPAIAINTDQRTVETADQSLPYHRVILATGSSPRQIPLPGIDAEGVYELRGIDHVDQIRQALARAERLVVIGAGYIGLEAAASARTMGLDVTVLEYADRVLARVTSEPISRFFHRLHEANGVAVVTQARIASIASDGGKVTGVVMEDGHVHPADTVLIGVGITPNTTLAEAAGIHCDNGIEVDRDARTSNPDIYAAGDCTSRELVHYQRRGRLESVHNAVEQGKQAAAHIMGKPRPQEEAPWFWSDQYEVKLQIAGLSEGFENTVVRGDPESSQFALFYLSRSRLLAVDAINSPLEFVFSRKLIAAGGSVNADDLADPAIKMKDLADQALKGDIT